MPSYLLWLSSVQWRKSRGQQGDTSPQMSDREGTVMHHVPPPNMAEISLHKRHRIRLYLLNYVIVLFLSNISCLQLCQMWPIMWIILSNFGPQAESSPPKFPIRFTPLHQSIDLLCVRAVETVETEQTSRKRCVYEMKPNLYQLLKHCSVFSAIGFPLRTVSC